MSLIASSDRFVESVRMYVMRPSSYSFWAIRIVVFTENPSLFPASCCRVEVVNGGAGARFTGFTLKSATEKEADAQCSRKTRASSSVAIRRFSSALNGSPEFPENWALILKKGSGLNASTSFSRSQISLTATLCTRPADSAGLIFFQRIGLSSKPTILSSTLRACCAFTLSISIVLGFSMACMIAGLVIS